MRASVIIPVFNNETTIERLIQSLLDQTIPQTEYEILAVDGGSKDKTLEILEKYHAQTNLRIIKQEKNNGIGGGRNEGIKNSQSPILLFIDGDMEVKPDWVENHLLPIETGKWDGAVGSVEYKINENTKFTRYLNRPKRGATAFQPGTPINHRIFVFWNCAIRKKLLMEAGLFDESITTYGGEELEVIYRVEQTSPQALLTYNPNACSIHYQFRSLDRNLYLLEKFGEIVIPFLVKKHPPLADEFKINLIKKSFLFRTALKISASRLIKNRIIKTFPLLPDSISFLFIRFLLYSQCYKGVLHYYLSQDKN